MRQTLSELAVQKECTIRDETVGKYFLTASFGRG